jgi:phage I-like protein
MNLTHIQARFGPSEIGNTAPNEIVYIPEGEHEIRPEVNGKPGKITVRVPKGKGASIAATLQADLEKRLSDNVRPIIDFDHNRSGAAAAIPSRFRYQEGLGVVLALDWTSSGRQAIEGRDFSYFSPEFLIQDDGTPGGLPAKGAIGALVNNPAFRSMPRIAAHDSSAVATDEVIDAALWQGAGASTFGRSVFNLIAAGDTESVDDAMSVAAANDPAAYDAYCRALAKGRGLTAVAASEKKHDDPLQEMSRRGQVLVAAGQAESDEDGLMRAAEADPVLYQAYCRSLHKKPPSR